MSDQLKELMRGYENKYPQQLAEQFPRIVGQIVMLWDSTDALEAYFQKLLVADRPNRQGFPAVVASELFSLNRIYGEIRQKKPSFQSAWEDVSLPEPAKKEERINNSANEHSMFRAAEWGERETVVRLLREGLEPEIRDDKGWTPLMIASFQGHTEIVIVLIQHGAKVCSRDRDSCSPIHWAAAGGFEDIVKLLLNNGAWANPRNRFGVTPLLPAVAKGHLGAVNVLLAAGANPNEPMDDGSSPLHKAVAGGHVEIIEVLLQRGANLFAENVNGETPFQSAQISPHPKVREAIEQWVSKMQLVATAEVRTDASAGNNKHVDGPVQIFSRPDWANKK
ncbi:MAG: ankyrin repeat domain-containing protein [Pseudomonadota bacterium]